MNNSKIIQLLFLILPVLVCTAFGKKKQSEEEQVQAVQTPNVQIDLNPDPQTPTKIPQSNDKVKAIKGDDANIYLNFENASLSSVLNYLGEQKKINVIPHKDLEAVKVSLTTRKPLTLTQAWDVLLTLMEMNGFTINNVDGVHRIVQSQLNGAEPLPIYSSRTGTEPEQLPDSDIVLRYVYFFKNMKADLAQNILSSMMEGDRPVQINADLQVCILKEKSYNIKAAMKIIKALDTGGLRESIRIIPLKEADAEVVQKLFDEILETERRKSLRFAASSDKSEQRYFSSAIKIIAYPAKNALILLGTEKDVQRIVDFTYKYIDVPIGTASSRLHIKEVKYVKAELLRPILASIIIPPKGQGSEKTAIIGQYKFFEDVIIVAEEPGEDANRGSGNRLIISCNNDDWLRLSRFIDKLDKPQPQIAFEVLIVNILVNDTRELGAQVQTEDDLGMGVNRISFNNLDNGKGLGSDQDPGITPKPAEIPLSRLIDIVKKNATGDVSAQPTYMTFGNAVKEKIWGLVRAVLRSDNTNIIDQPYIVTNNGQKCKLDVATIRRVAGPLRAERSENKVATKENKKAGTVIELTPYMNVEGILTLDVSVNVDQFTNADPNTPTVLKRLVDTRTTMASGEVLVLGGLTQNLETTKTYKTPILGDIPIIGNLFKSKEKKIVADNLYIFIRPSVIKPRFEGTPDEYTQLKLDYAKLNMMRHNAYLQDKDPIQRWFFKPAVRTTNYYSVSDAKKGVFRPIDDFVYSRRAPKSVDMPTDPYYRSTEAVKQAQEALKRRTKPLANA